MKNIRRLLIISLFLSYLNSKYLNAMISLQDDEPFGLNLLFKEVEECPICMSLVPQTIMTRCKTCVNRICVKCKREIFIRAKQANSSCYDYLNQPTVLAIIFPIKFKGILSNNVLIKLSQVINNSDNTEEVLERLRTISPATYLKISFSKKNLLPIIQVLIRIMKQYYLDGAKILYTQTFQYRKKRYVKTPSCFVNALDNGIVIEQFPSVISIPFERIWFNKIAKRNKANCPFCRTNFVGL